MKRSATFLMRLDRCTNEMKEYSLEGICEVGFYEFGLDGLPNAYYMRDSAVDEMLILEEKHRTNTGHLIVL